MARKKLSVKTEKKNVSLSKKLQTKIKKSELSNIFSLDKPIFMSATIVTDDNSIVLILEDTDQFLINNKIENTIETFDIDVIDLQLEFNRQEKLEYYKEDDLYKFESIGNITENQFNWFRNNYPMCAFYQIEKWFGKSVNTLVIVLAEELGKPVGILKTTE